jgi:hypothetical protein
MIYYTMYELKLTDRHKGLVLGLCSVTIGNIFSGKYHTNMLHF